MTQYKVNISRDEYGYLLVNADSEEQARDIVESGDWSDDEYNAKGGQITVDSIETVE